MPLAWMLGACVFSTVAAFLGLRIGMRVRLRQGMIIILGVLLGSGFTPDLVQRLGEWAVSLCVLTGMTMTGATLCYVWLRVFTGWDKVTCYFAAMPGGLNDMTIMGGAMGGDERSIALAHALRILTVVLTIPIWYRLVNGAQTSVLTMVHGPTGNDWKDYAVLIGCGVVGAAAGRLLRLPASLHDGADDRERHRPSRRPHQLPAAGRAGRGGAGRGRHRHRLPLRRRQLRQAAQGDGGLDRRRLHADRLRRGLRRDHLRR